MPYKDCSKDVNWPACPAPLSHAASLSPLCLPSPTHPICSVANQLLGSRRGAGLHLRRPACPLAEDGRALQEKQQQDLVRKVARRTRGCKPGRHKKLGWGPAGGWAIVHNQDEWLLTEAARSWLAERHGATSGPTAAGEGQSCWE